MSIFNDNFDLGYEERDRIRELLSIKQTIDSAQGYWNEVPNKLIGCCQDDRSEIEPSSDMFQQNVISPIISPGSNLKENQRSDIDKILKKSYKEFIHNQRKKGFKTPEEDKYLIKLYATSNFKNKWLKISEFIKSQSSSQCRNRYIKLRKFNKNSKLQLGANDKEDYTIDTISIIKDEIPRLFKIFKEPRTSNNPINNNIYESGENINTVQMKEEIRKFSDPDDILAHPNFFELARTNTPDDLPEDSNSTERTDNMFQNEYFRTFKNVEDNHKFNHENELKYILNELSSTNLINTIQEKKYEISVEDMQSTQNYNNLMKTNQIIKSHVEQQKPNNESVICLSDRIKEIENIINSQNFLSFSQQNKMMQYSILLMEINLFSTRITFNEQEMKLTMGIQSKILQAMIQETQRQLITDDGDNMYIKID